MTLQECYDYCQTILYRKGQKVKSGSTIKTIIPAPPNNKIFLKYIEYAFKTDNHIEAQRMTSAFDFEPLIIYNSPNLLLVYDWYWNEFPDEKSPQVL